MGFPMPVREESSVVGKCCWKRGGSHKLSHPDHSGSSRIPRLEVPASSMGLFFDPQTLTDSPPCKVL